MLISGKIFGSIGAVIYIVWEIDAIIYRIPGEMEQAKLFIQNSIQPLTSYPGSKAGSGTWQKIISEIPKCDLFIEAMCGSAYLSSLVLKTGCSVVVNDIDRSVIDRINFAAGNITFLSLDYLLLINQLKNSDNRRVFYFDPPYLFSTRSSQRKLYSYEWNEKDHETFLAAVLRIKNPTIVSHYPCDMYDKALHKWRQITYNTMTRAGVREERIYMNFPQPALLQCHGHVGDNFTDRQRIKRKVERLINRLQNEPEKERAAILSSIIEHFSYVAENS